LSEYDVNIVVVFVDDDVFVFNPPAKIMFISKKKITKKGVSKTFFGFIFLNFKGG
jgi:hypothetical protein